METIAEFNELLRAKGQLKECPLCGDTFVANKPERLICYSSACEKKYRDTAEYKKRIELLAMLLELNKPIEKDDTPKPPKHERKTEKVYRRNRPGYVYLMRSENGLYKIGRAINTRNRLDGLNREIPVEVKLIHAVECEDYIATERLLHSRFAKKRVKYEWFRLDNEDVDWFLKLDSDTMPRWALRWQIENREEC